MKYIEIAQGDVKHRGMVIAEDKLQEKIEQNQEKNEELYYTVWSFDEELKEHFKVYNTIRSFRGKCYLNYVIFDIDKGSDTDDFVLRRAQELVRRIEQDWDVRPEELRLYYSGRGYHVYMPNYFKFEPSEALRQEAKNTIKEYFPEADLAIYGATALIRAPYSINKKTNRYKIPLTTTEFFTLTAEEIITLAESNEDRDVPVMEEVERDFSTYIVKAIVEREALHYRDEPTRVVTCMQHLYNKGATNGSRHNEAMRLTSAYRRQGVAKTAVQKLLYDWAPSLENYEIDRIVNNVFDKGYRYGCSDFIMAKFCDPKCVYYTHKNYEVSVTQPDEMDALLTDFAVKLPYKKYIDLDEFLKLDSPYRIYEGELIVFYGDTKIGKSTLAQNIMIATPLMKWLLMPLENGRVLDGRRLIQMAYGWDKVKTLEELKTPNNGIYSRKCGHIKMVDTSVNLKDLQKIIIQSEADAVLIDTADQIKVYTSTGREITNYTEKMEVIATGLTDIKRSTNKTIGIVHHIAKSKAEDEDGRRKAMTIHSLKGASAVEQKADKVISIEGNRDDAERIIKSQGARDEAPFKKLVKFNKETFRLEIE